MNYNYPPNQQVPPPPGRGRKQFPWYGYLFIGLFLLFITYQVWMFMNIFNDMRDFHPTVSDDLYVRSYTISYVDSAYTYRFKITNNMDETFTGRIDMAFDRKDVAYGFNQTIDIDPLPPYETSQFEFKLEKAPRAVDREDGLHEYKWSAKRSEDSKTIARGEGKLVEVVELQ